MIVSKHFFKTALICAGLFTSSAAFAQDEVSRMFVSSPEDATKLAQAYLNPLFKGFGIGLNSGWNNTGRAKNTGRFELRVGFTGAFVPVADQSFDVTKLGLSSSLRPAAGSGSISPTVASSSPQRVILGVYNENYQNGTEPIETFELPDGANIPFIPAPQLQATVGLPKGIDVTLRAMPKVNLGDYGSMGMIGGGIKVDVLPLLLNKTADKVLPVDLGLALGYTMFNYELPLEVETESGAPRDPDQKIDSRFSGVNVEAIVSRKMLFFTPFLSVGYNSAKTDLSMKGRYEFREFAADGSSVIRERVDPVSIKNSDIGGMRANAGFQLNLAILRLYASYSVAEYNSFNAGIGIGLGK
ncbi:MAG TPA: DUF6588 family protein [Sphingobacteriaceae bacterium]